MDRLQHLLDLQGEARQKRQTAIAQRDEVVRRAESEGRVHLDESEENECDAHTRQIASLDVEIETRDEKIRELAELHGLPVPGDPEPDVADAQRAAAAQIFVDWRKAEPKTRGAVTDDEPQPAQRKMTVTQARAVISLDTTT